METILQKTLPWKSQEDTSAQVNGIKNIKFKGILGTPEEKNHEDFAYKGSPRIPTNTLSF